MGPFVTPPSPRWRISWEPPGTTPRSWGSGIWGWTLPTRPPSGGFTFSMGSWAT